MSRVRVSSPAHLFDYQRDAAFGAPSKKPNTNRNTNIGFRFPLKSDRVKWCLVASKVFFSPSKKNGSLVKIFFKIRGVKRHSPTKKHSAPPAEAASSAQPNMAALGKMLEAMLAMCGASVPAVPSSGGGPVGEGAIVTVSASELVDAMLNRMYRRMPKSGTDGIPAECCPYSGLNRSALYEFMSLRDDDGNPVIKTVTLKGEKEKHGARFYSVGSVLSHLDRLAAKQSNEGTAKEDHGERP